MQSPALIVFGVVVVLASLAKGAKNGCAWSGCDYSGTRCATGLTGGSGRNMERKSVRCGFLRRGHMDFCCDQDCTYQKCGKNCGKLGMSDWSSEMPSQDCTTYDRDGDAIEGRSFYCCPK